MNATSKPGDAPGRPPVSVVVPFSGDAADARALVGTLEGLTLRDGDELIAVDNEPAGHLVAAADGSAIRVVAATEERSSYYARNVGALVAGNEWLLFVDADCRPRADILDAYFADPPGDRVGALAGSIQPAEQPGLLPRWAASRELINQETLLSGGGAATANLLVRRSVWASLGGFHEGVRSGADIEFCWRLQDAGWTLEGRLDAAVSHLHRTSVREVMRQMARYGAGNAWQERRRPGSVPGLALAAAVPAGLAGALVYLVTLRPRRAAMKVLDCVALCSSAIGRLQGNAAPRDGAVPGPASRGAEKSVVIATDYFPALSETFVSADISSLSGAGWRVRVEAIERPARPRIEGSRGLTVNHLEDEGTIQRLRSLGWLALSHPVGCLADIRRRRRFAAEERMPLRAIAPFARRIAAGGERRIHVHFALMAEVNALRAGAIVGVPVSVAAHAHEIFVNPRSLPAKLSQASFAVADCDYTVEHLRGLLPANAGKRVHKIVLGVDVERFRRAKPHPAERTVVAVGRLVEKKGFAHLIEAAARVPDGGVESVLIAGDGPLRAQLETLVERLDLGGRVRLLGSLEPEAVRELLERADLLCMPCVVAADGDRDSMPVVVKEALAMEIPVVASDAVGLPEIVAPEWGRLTPAGDPDALAAAIVELLELPSERRAEMGRLGREKVERDANLAIESAKLARLLEESARSPSQSSG